MKKTLAIVSVALLTACTGNKTNESANNTATDSIQIEEVVAEDTQVAELTPIENCDWEAIAVAREFLSTLHSPEFNATLLEEDWLKSHCSPQVLQKLRDDNTYEGDGYAAWELAGNIMSEEENANSEVIAVGYGSLNGIAVHEVVKQYTDGMGNRSEATFYYGLEPKGEEDQMITYFSFVQPKEVEDENQE